MYRRKRVVITGVGVISPYGVGKRKFWSGLKKGKSAINPITIFDTKRLPCKRAGEVTNFNAKRLLGAKGLRHLTRSTQFALVASKLALDDALLSYPIPDRAADSYGVSVGTAVGNIQSMLEFDRKTLVGGPRSVNPADFPSTIFNTIASHISIKFNITGFNATVSTSLASGLDAISYASNMIRNYGYKVVLAGSVEELTLEMFMGFVKLKCLAGSRSGKDKEISCPYDRRRKGIVLSEGASIFVLEDLEHAEKRKAKIYAELKSYGSSFDPKSIGGYNVAAEGAGEAINQALTGFDSKDKIDCIIGSANSTLGCDYMETQAIKRVFGKKAKEMPLTSIKSMIGETFGAGGAFNTAAAIGALQSDFIPPTINYRVPDRRCDLHIIANKVVKKKLNNILINSFSHNGHNSSVIIGRKDS